ncbi:MAG: hypothetical protein EOP04_13510 [Proteobacteria bacterium]|nr:MAG: hypothetical protein EOP04_13510 [Pseudomonadota bacterium]
MLRQSIEIARENGIDSAERYLADYWNEPNIDFLLTRARILPRFTEREKYFRFASEDYVAGRFYASIPLALMMIDGLVNDIQEKGFFSEKSDFAVWDSLAGHSSGLESIKNIMNVSRKKTNVNAIKVPYRNGILHGRELSYDNKIVASKCWGVLQAILDWYIGKQSEDERRLKYGADSRQSISAVYRQIIENGTNRSALQRWAPRVLHVEIDFPKSGLSTQYRIGSPERCVADIMNNITKKNFGALCEFIKLGEVEQLSRSAGRIREIFKHVEIVRWEIFEIVDNAPALSKIFVKLYGRREGTLFEKEIQIIVLFYSLKGEFAVHGVQEGTWKIRENELYSFQ